MERHIRLRPANVEADKRDRCQARAERATDDGARRFWTWRARRAEHQRLEALLVEYGRMGGADRDAAWIAPAPVRVKR